jgi:predicted esterase
MKRNNLQILNKLSITLFLVFLNCNLLNSQVTGNFEIKIGYGKSNHTIAYSVPATYNPAKKYPLIVGLHYCGGSASEFRNALKDFSTKKDAIVMCPDNFQAEFNNATAGLILNSIDTTRLLYNIDTTMVFFTGFSCNASEVLQRGLQHFYNFRGIFPWEPYLPSLATMNLNYNSNMPVTLSAGNADPSFDNDINVYDSLVAHKANVNLIVVPNVNHTLGGFMGVMLKAYDYLLDSNYISISPIANMEIPGSSSEIKVSINNISHKKNAEIEVNAFSSFPNIIPNPKIEFPSGSGPATLSFKPAENFLKNTSVKIIVEVKEKNGNGIEQMVFNVNIKYVIPNKPVTASSSSTFVLSPENALDGNLKTQWVSKASDPQWICIDLIKPVTVSGVTLSWGAIYGTEYKIQVSNDSKIWKDIYSTSAGAGKREKITFDPVHTQYVRMYGTKRQANFGYSLFEFQVDTSQITGIQKNNSGAAIDKFNLKTSPNPFSNSITIEYSLPQPSKVELSVFNLQGQQIANLENRNKNSGNYQVKWNGTDAQNNLIGSGVYFLIAKINNAKSTRKLIFFK